MGDFDDWVDIPAAIPEHTVFRKTQGARTFLKVGTLDDIEDLSLAICDVDPCLSCPFFAASLMDRNLPLLQDPTVDQVELKAEFCDREGAAGANEANRGASVATASSVVLDIEDS